MVKLVVLSPQDEQRIIEIHPSGGYYDEARILWDERKDGPLPAIATQKLGGLVRSGSQLVEDAQKLSDYLAAKEARETQEAAKRTALQQAKTAIKNVDLKSSLTAGQVETLIKAIVLVLRNLD